MDIEELTKKANIEKEKYNAVINLIKLDGDENIIDLLEIRDIIKGELINYFDSYYNALTILNEAIVEKMKNEKR